jgi:hypothetical protein
MALGYAVFAQGAFYGHDFRWLIVLLAVAAGLAWLAAPPRLSDLAHPLLGTFVALALWSIVSAAWAGDVWGAGPVVGLLACAAAVTVVVNRLSGPNRAVLEGGILALGVLTALDGWFGVAWHSRPAALTDQGLWRAASPITYANGTAGLLVPLALFALARYIDGDPDGKPNGDRDGDPGDRDGDPGTRRGQVARALAAYVLLCGAGATLSRAGGLALAAGLVVLAACRGPWHLVTCAGPILLAAAVGLSGLLPAAIDGSPTRPGVPVASALAGALVVVLVASTRRRRLVPLGLLIGVLVATGAVASHHRQFDDALRRVRAVRLNATSTDRKDEWRETLRLAGRHPITGIGPGNFDLVYRTAGGATFSVKYAHNEYLQFLAEEGAVGLAALAGGLILTSVFLVGAVRAGRAEGAAVLTAWVALLVHSSFDFLWHIPAVVLVLIALAALSLAPAGC